MLKMFGLTILPFLFTGITSSQVKEITKEEFSNVYYSALDKARQVDRRFDSKLESYQDGKVHETEEWFYEYSTPYKRHLVYTKVANEKSSRVEEINIDENNFCRFETRSWEKKDTNCLTGFPALKSQASHQVLGIVSTRFTVDDVSLGGTKARIFTEFTKYKNQALPNNDGDRLRYYESRFWLGEKGLILRQEIRSGFVVEKDISSMWIDIYDYNPKDLKIEAPIN